MGDSMYCEELPEACPPLDAVGNPLSNVYRRVDTAAPVASDFASHAFLGKEPKFPVDPCKWASCSFFRDKKKISDISKKLPKPRTFANFIAQLDIPADTGRWKEDKKGHIDFWMYASFDPLSAIVDIQPVDQT